MIIETYAVALYAQRWRIEDAYNVVKRLLGLAYFWTGAQNSIEMQLWATWLLYAVLVDLTDAVADALHQPFARISSEMIYRSLYFWCWIPKPGKVLIFSVEDDSSKVLQESKGSWSI